MQTRLRHMVLVVTAGAVSVGGLTGCQSLGNRERGAIIGAAGGGIVGGAVGTKNGGVTRGAIVGAVLGGAAGAIIGHQMDQQAKELEQNVPGAIVERVGEGIAVTFASGILYDFDSSVLKPGAQENLANLASSLDKYPGTSLLISGHTDSVGTDSYNATLSKQRADAAARYLAARGVSMARINTMGLGENEPKVSNDSEAGRAQNRRVEVAIYASEAMRADAKRQAGANN